MAVVSISQASKLVARDRRTIERYLGSGKLSCTTDVAGKRVIDTSELMRVFGDLSHPVAPSVAALNHDMSHPAEDGEKDALKAHIRTLEHQVDELRTEKGELRAQLAGLLEDRRQKHPQRGSINLSWTLGLGFVGACALAAWLAYGH